MPPKRNRSGGIAGGIGALVVVGLITWVVVAGNSESNSSSSASPSCDAQCQSAVLALGSETPVPTFAPSSEPPSTSMGQQITAWYDATGKTDLLAIEGDQSAIGTDSGAGDVNAVNSDCSSLKSDVVTFEADPAAPDPTVRSDLAHAMDAYSTAATECLDGDYADAGTDENTGTKWIANTTERIEQLGGG